MARCVCVCVCWIFFLLLMIDEPKTTQNQHRIRKLWHHYYENTTALIYMVDSADPDRIEEAAEELHAALECEHLASSVSVSLVPLLSSSLDAQCR